MKKFFKSLAFASAALAGILVSSCKIEDIETTFTAENAVAKIEVTVLDAETGLDVSNKAEITAVSSNGSKIEVDGNIVKVTGNKDIKENIVTVSASYNGLSAASVDVKINPLLAGGRASYGATLIVGYIHPVENAKAFISYNVIDLADGKDITATSKVSFVSSLVGTPLEAKDGVVVLEGYKDLEAQNVTFYAKAADGREASSVVVPVKALPAGQTAAYVATLTVAAPVPPEPVKDPAYATITVSVVDLQDGQDVTAVSYITAETDGSDATLVQMTANTFKLTAKEGDLAAQTLTVNASFGDRQANTVKVQINAVPAGDHAEYAPVAYVPAVEPEPQNDPAMVRIHYTVFDLLTSQFVTPSSTTLSGYDIVMASATEDKENAMWVLEARRDTYTIAATTFEFTATYEGETSEVYSIELENNVNANEVVDIYVKATVRQAPEPVENPAELLIHVTVIDDRTGEDVTDKSIILAMSDSPSFGGCSTGAGLVTIIHKPGQKTFEAMDITLTADYEEYSDEMTLSFPAIAVNEVVETYVTFHLATPEDPEISYNYEFQGFGEPITVVGYFNPTHFAGHAHDYSHAVVGHGHGEGNWAYNESEFILTGEVEYTNEYGTFGENPAYAPYNAVLQYTTECTEPEQETANNFFSLLAADTYVSEPAVLEIKVSAWAMFTVYATKTYVPAYYTIVRAEKGKALVTIANATVYSVTTNAEYCEAAVPGHDGHYSPGHGHDSHDHGHGSNNAGGGIIWAD